MSGRGIVLYDFLHCQGGAERLTLDLVRGLPNADLGFGFRDIQYFPDTLLDGIRFFDLGVKARFVGGRTVQGLLAYRKRTGFLRDYDWVIYSGSVAPEAVYNHPEGLNLYYCHTIPRFAYDLRDYYVRQLNWWQFPVFQALGAYVRHRYPRALRRMDLIIANSENVRRRIRKYLDLDSVVVHPPCDVEGYRWLGQEDYYLSTARLEPYKRVDLIVEAFGQMPDKRLIVASGGSDLERLKGLARGADNIRFTGWIDDAELRKLTGKAIATIYLPKDEDFGMSPVESMAAGKPVLGVAEGGLMETVVSGETGLLIGPEPKPDAVIEAVRVLDPQSVSAMRSECEARARLFSRERFLDQMRALVTGR
ncbi:MAG: glycosyltransferase [Pseudomonadota bacterium]|nr:glycosyltransferase [Pseudomonadota bacterium]